MSNMTASQHWSFVGNNTGTQERASLAKLYNNGIVNYIIFQKQVNDNNKVEMNGFLSLTTPRDMQTVQSLLGTNYSVAEAMGTLEEDSTKLTKSCNRLLGPWQYGSVECDPWLDGDWLDTLSEDEWEELLPDQPQPDLFTESQLMDFLE